MFDSNVEGWQILRGSATWLRDTEVTHRELSVDGALLEDWQPWIKPALRRFGATGFGDVSTSLTSGRLLGLLDEGHLVRALAIQGTDGSRGLVIVTHATWETSVVSRPIARIAWLAADTFEIARALADAAMESARLAGIVLMYASPGHSPAHVHVALTEAGFHVASQALTVRADLEAIAPAVARVPLRGTFRPATPEDAVAVGELARNGFSDARYVSDPFFPAEWGQAVYAAWGRVLVLGGADSVVVAEAGGRLIGFVSMTLDPAKSAKAPPLLAIERGYEGWGIGAMLVRIMFDWYRERGLKIFSGRTEKSNLPINALYLRLGASFVDANIVYHAAPMAP